MNIVMHLILTTTLRNSLKYDKFLFFDNNLICFATKISSMPNISNLIYIYIFNILHNLTFSLQKKKTCPSKALSMHTIFSIHVYRFHCGKKCFNVICMYKTTY